MKMIKKYVIIILSLCLIVNSTGVIFAKWDESLYTHLYRHQNKENVKLDDNIIEYNEIEDLVFHKNPTMRNAWLVFDVNKDINDTSKTYYEAADALDGSTGDEATDAMNAARAQGLRISGDNAVDDSNTNYLKNIKQEKSIILDTKIAFINYYKNKLLLEQANKNFENAYLLYDSALANFEAGNLTNTELLKSESDFKQAIANIELAKSNIITSKRTVLVNCGFYMDASIELGNINHISSELIDARNDFEDKNTAIENNLQYQIYKLQLENSHSEEMRTTNKINVDNAEKYIINDIDSKYQNMHDGLTAVYTAALAVKTTQDDYNHMQVSYNQGAVSKKEFNMSLVKAGTALLDLEIKFCDSDILYETYMASIDGLASASAQG